MLKNQYGNLARICPLESGLCVSLFIYYYIFQTADLNLQVLPLYDALKGYRIANSVDPVQTGRLHCLPFRVHLLEVFF